MAFAVVMGIAAAVGIIHDGGGMALCEEHMAILMLMFEQMGLNLAKVGAIIDPADSN